MAQMDGKEQNFKQLAGLITADIIERLQLTSSSGASNLIGRELSKLSESLSNLGSKVIELNSRAGSITSSFNSTSKILEPFIKQLELNTSENYKLRKSVETLNVDINGLIRAVKSSVTAYEQKDSVAEPVSTEQLELNTSENYKLRKSVETLNVNIVGLTDKVKSSITAYQQKGTVKESALREVTSQEKQKAPPVATSETTINEPGEPPKSELKAEERIQKIDIVHIDPDAGKSISVPLLGPLEELNKHSQKTEDGILGLWSTIKEAGKDKEGGILGSLFKSLGTFALSLSGATLILGGLASLTAAFTTNTGEKGVLELISKAGVKGGLGLIAKAFTKIGTRVLKSIPVVGGLISLGFAVQRFTNGDTVGGILELGSGIAGLFPGVGTAVSFGIDALQAILDAKAGGSSEKASGKKVGILLDWAKSLGTLIDERIKYVPIIGPIYEFGRAIENGNMVEAIKQLAYIFPPFQWLGMFIGEETVNKGIETGMQNISGAFTAIQEWIEEKVANLPVIGSLINGIESAIDDPLEFLKSLPGAQSIVEFFNFATSGKVVETSIQFAKDSYTKVVDWLTEKMLELPIIGPLLKSVGNFIGDPIGVLRSLGESYPAINSVISFFESVKEFKIPTLSFEFENPFEGLNKMVSDKVEKWWEGTKDWISGLNPFSKKEISKKPQLDAGKEMYSSPISPEKDTVKPLEDSAIDPQGGLIISSPKLGSLYQLNKKDGIVSGPLTEGSQREMRTKTNSFATMESLLEKVVANTFVTNQNMTNLIIGFNKMAKALQDKVGQDLSVPVVVNQTSQNSSNPTFNQYANSGNPEISNFRRSIIEGSRFQPA
jgi:hypothetical protein